MNRREFLTLGGVAAVAGTGVLTSSNTTSDLIFEEISLKYTDLDLSLNGLKIGFITDIHVGPLMDYSLLDRAIEELSKSDLDILLLGGDYIGLSSILGNKTDENIFSTTYIEKEIRNLADAISEIPTRLGTYAVLGNHDNWHARDIIIDIFKSSKIKLIINDKVVIQNKLQIVGVDDYWTGIPQIPEVERALFTILLAHNPDYIFDTIQNNTLKFDLGLAGHTHGGQVCLPLWGPIAKNIEHPEFFIGLKDLGGRYVFTSAGVGVAVIPFRINCKPEIQVLTLIKEG